MTSKSHTCTCPECNHVFDIALELDPGGMEGMDADGNRGWYIPPFFIAPDDVSCPMCECDMSVLVALEVEKLDPDEGRWEPEPEDVEDR